jgi:AmmeMemoRadiSam system protein B
MSSLERPKLRPIIPRRIQQQGRSFVLLQDAYGLVNQPLLLPFDGFWHIIRHFDGQSSLTEIQARVLQQTGLFLSLADLQDLVRRLDAAMIIDGPTFAAFLEEYRRTGRRHAAFAGRSYAGTLRSLCAQLEQFFLATDGAGLPATRNGDSPERLRGILSPHIDYQRGGPVYTWAYKELVERSPADTFVILGVAHQYCGRRFALTRKDFETPLGLVPTDRAYVDDLASLAGSDLFADELSHRTEHSIEFQVVFLQYLLGDHRKFNIVPILAGSFQDLVASETDPLADPEVNRFIDALRAVEAGSGKRVAYIGGIDLCHVGPEFGDPALVDPLLREEIRKFDVAMLERAAAGDACGWFQTAARVGNRWRVCGLAATYTMLHAMGPSQGRLLKYHQALDDRRTCLVSFASMAFRSQETSPPPLHSACASPDPS